MGAENTHRKTVVYKNDTYTLDWTKTEKDIDKMPIAGLKSFGRRKGEHKLKNKTVLLVDEDREFSKAMKKYLDKLGCNTVMAGDGRKAIDFLSEHAVDLIISEVRTAELCGIELMEEIKRRRIDTPVIFLTAHGEVESFMDLMNMGAFEYLNKPVKEQEILRVAQRAMEIQSNIALCCVQDNCQEERCDMQQPERCGIQLGRRI